MSLIPLQGKTGVAVRCPNCRRSIPGARPSVRMQVGALHVSSGAAARRHELQGLPREAVAERREHLVEGGVAIRSERAPRRGRPRPCWGERPPRCAYVRTSRAGPSAPPRKRSNARIFRTPSTAIAEAGWPALRWSPVAAFGGSVGRSACCGVSLTTISVGGSAACAGHANDATLRHAPHDPLHTRPLPSHRRRGLGRCGFRV